MWFVYGVKCLAAHLLFYIAFKYVLPQGPWRKAPNFTAHQLIALFLMIQWTCDGFFGDNTVDLHDKPDHLPKILHTSSYGLKMAQRSVAALWLWDIPIMILSKDMHQAMDGIMHAHHLGMLLVALAVLGYLTFGIETVDFPSPVGSPLAPIFFGQVELSSIPLQVVDLFHPRKSSAWNQYMKSSKILATINEASRQLFALLFLAVRGVYFPYVVFTRVIPDFWDALTWTALHQEQAAKYILPIVIILAFSVFFTLLQMYWAVLVVNQIQKALFGGKNSGIKEA